MLRVDHFSIFFHLVVLIVALATILMSLDYLPFQKIDHGEYYALILLGSVGMCLMSSAVELVLIFIALEISSISSYVLAGFRRHSAESAESSMKYFLLGSFATAFFLYGVALLYGATGSTNVFDIAAALSSSHIEPLAYIAVALIFTGLGFKVAAAPFHVWAPDVYEGAPSPVVAFLSTAPKAAAFAVLIRLVIDTASPHWFWIIWTAAVLSMCVGNLGAILQSNVKRMLAYSSIAHAGYAGRFCGGQQSRTRYLGSDVLFRLLRRHECRRFCRHHSDGRQWRAFLANRRLLRARKALAPSGAALTFFLLSLIGIPITGGFFAKFYVFSAALRTHLIWLTIIGVANSGMGSYYYLRVIVRMYMFEPRSEDPAPAVRFGVGMAIAISLVATLWLGVLPNAVLHYTKPPLPCSPATKTNSLTQRPGFAPGLLLRDRKICRQQ